jgi:hypothetical protein
MLGFMNTMNMKNTLPNEAVWGADNGCFSNPASYSDEKYLDWLRKQPIDRCLFAVAPDVLGNHRATIALSRPMLPQLRELGYRPAFVAQDGWTSHDTPWAEFDVLFIGGTDTFKLGPGGKAAHEALARGKSVHFARVNSYRRLRLAAALGCASADGTFLKWSPDANVPRMLLWLERLTKEPLLVTAKR